MIKNYIFLYSQLQNVYLSRDPYDMLRRNWMIVTFRGQSVSLVTPDRT